MERTSSKVIHEDPLILRNKMGREIKISLADNKQLVLLDHSQGKFCNFKNKKNVGNLMNSKNP